MCACMCVCVCVLSCVCVGNIITYTIQRSKANQIFPPSGEVGFGTLRWESTEIATYTHIRVCVCVRVLCLFACLDGWGVCLFVCVLHTFVLPHFVVQGQHKQTSKDPGGWPSPGMFVQPRACGQSEEWNRVSSSPKDMGTTTATSTLIYACVCVCVHTCACVCVCIYRCGTYYIHVHDHRFHVFLPILWFWDMSSGSEYSCMSSATMSWAETLL